MRVYTDTIREFSPAEASLTSLDNCRLLLARAVDEVRTDRTDPALYTDASYFHPNGFTRISVPQEPQHKGRLYINVWQPGVVESDVHDHAFDFFSTIISGTLRHKRWADATSKQDGIEGTRYLHDRGSTEASAGKAHLKNIGRTTLKAIDDITFRVGDSYFLEHTQPHSVTPDAAFVTRTLVQQLPDVSLTTTVFRPDGKEREQNVYTKLTLSEYMQELEAALASVTEATHISN